FVYMVAPMRQTVIEALEYSMSVSAGTAVMVAVPEGTLTTAKVARLAGVSLAVKRWLASAPVTGAPLTLRATEAVTGTAVPVGASASAWNSTRYTPGWATFTAPLPGAWVRFVPKPATSVLKSS